MSGVITVPGGAGGFLLGGVIIKRMSLGVVRQLRGMFLLGVLGVCAMLMFCVQCDYAPLAETSLHQHHQLADRLVRHITAVTDAVVKTVSSYRYHQHNLHQQLRPL